MTHTLAWPARQKRNQALIILLFMLALGLAGCNPAVSLRPLVGAKDKPVTEPQVEGDWVSIDVDKLGKNDVTVQWKIGYQKDHYAVEMHLTKSDDNQPPQTDVYAASLLNLDGKLFFDARFTERRFSALTIQAGDIEPLMAPVHLVGRLWMHPDYLRLALMDSSWLQDNAGDDFRVVLPTSGMEPATAVITTSSDNLQKFLDQNADSDAAFALEMYLCRSAKDCAPLIVEDELTRKPDDHDFLHDAARFFTSRGDNARALTLLRHRAELQPQDAASIEDLGVALLYTRDFQGARREFASAQKLAPDNQTFQVDIGWSYFLEGSFREAAKAFDESLKSAKNSSADPVLGEYYSLLRLGRGSEAEALLSQQTAKFVAATEEHALLLEAQGQASDTALAVSNDAELARVHLFEGLRWIAKGQSTEAAGSFKKTLEKAEPGSLLALLAATELQGRQPKTKSPSP